MIFMLHVFQPYWTQFSIASWGVVPYNIITGNSANFEALNVRL